MAPPLANRSRRSLFLCSLQWNRTTPIVTRPYTVISEPITRSLACSSPCPQNSACP
jgi:hypothetical protein